MSQMLRLLLFYILFFLDKSSATTNCPTGTIAGTDATKCYKYYMAPTNFYDAETQCTLNAGHLVSSTNGFINSFIADMAKSIIPDTNAQIWLGGSYSSNWTWTDGQPFTYTHWAKGQPNMTNGCTAMQISSSYWYSQSCNLSLPYFCEIPASVPVAPTCNPFQNSTSIPCPTSKPIVVSPCESTWTFYNITNACYKVFHSQNWTTSESICVQNNAHLTSIHSLEENSFLVELASSGNTIDPNNWPYSEAWIGLIDLNGDGIFSWTDGTPLDYIKWGPPWPALPLSVHKYVGLIVDPVNSHPGYFQTWFNWDAPGVCRAYICKKLAKNF